MEMGGIRDPRQRFAIADLMEELSGFSSLLARDKIMEMEFEASLEAMGFRRTEPLATVDLLAEGVGHAFGFRGGLRVVKSTGEDRTTEARDDWPDGPEAFDEFQRKAELWMNQSILRGPSDADVPDLQNYGWNLQSPLDVAVRRAQQEAELPARLQADSEPTGGSRSPCLAGPAVARRR
jgi:hypothetical protein